MKRSLLFIIGSFVVAAIWIPAQAEKRISVAQFEQTVAALKNAADSEAAQRISELQLTERLSPLRLATLSQTIPGEKFRQALRAIADQSAFLPPPSSEIPSNPAPPVAEQRRIMGLVATYVEHTIPQLPNFFATRTTDHFEDTPLVQHAGDFFTPYRPLHFLSHSEAAVFYQKGREVVDTAGSSRQNRRDITLRYRTGYLYEKEPATLKERFQNAVWHPADQSEIALSATPARDGKAASLKLNIAATDIALAEQAGLWTDKLDIFLVQRDDAKLHGKLEGQTLSLRLKPSTYQQVLRDGINIDETIRSLPENGALRVVVVDENTGRIGTLTLPVTALNRK
jgi:hypothetical protein